MLKDWHTRPAHPKVAFARRLRREQTHGERLLWYALRDRRLHTLKFRRQVPVGPYIVDFLCREKKFIVEVDGDTHFEPGALIRDYVRETWLRIQGFKIFRCGNREVIENAGNVIERLEDALALSPWERSGEG